MRAASLYEDERQRQCSVSLCCESKLDISLKIEVVCA